ncbi:hypothetical protein M5K25_020869 [Dendrobium thyrsiflorum]|uniref:DEAD-box ATP-dependent RNA helicase 33 n=1 Tax=Dendrobium thyrsiflorum TaxID=117978 RepID=A0ABD0UB44_DENTH
MPSAAIFPASLAIPRASNRSISSCRAFTGLDLFRPFSIAPSSLTAAGDPASLTTIRMGGGPRTYPGGVSKWQWKRMQAKKSKQLLKARLCRERQLYEMRKRAELKAAISELERPWEVVERAPVLFSASADEQVKALADRFQRPNGFDMWSERDGPRLFRSPDDLPSARFFPKGAVHSVKPYGVVTEEVADGGEEREKDRRYDDCIARGAGGMGTGRHVRVSPDSSSLESERSVPVEEKNGDAEGNLGSYYSDSEFAVAGSRKAENKMVRRFARHGRNRNSSGAESNLALDGSSINGDDKAGDFGRRSSRGRYWSSRVSDSEQAEAGSRMEKHEIAGSFGRRGGRGGRGRYRNSYGSHKEFAVNGSRMGRDETVSDFGQRGGGDRNQGSYESHSELAVASSRMQRQEMAGVFDRRRGRGVRGGNRGSYRSYSELEKDENDGGFSKRSGRSGNRNGIDGIFDRHRGRGGNRGSNRSYSDLAIAGSRKEKDEIAGGFGKRGGRSGNRNSYGSDSELAIADSWKERVEMAGGRDRHYSYRGRVSLRPTTELRLEEGGHVRRETKSEGRTEDFRVSREIKIPQ